MDRRKFLKGAVATAVAAAIPGAVATNPYLSANEWQPMGYTYKTYGVSTMPRDLGCQMARALARSMMQTREIVAANVLNKAFGE